MLVQQSIVIIVVDNVYTNQKSNAHEEMILSKTEDKNEAHNIWMVHDKL